MEESGLKRCLVLVADAGGKSKPTGSLISDLAQSASLEIVVLNNNAEIDESTTIRADFADVHIETTLNGHGFEPVLFVFSVEPRMHFWFASPLSRTLKNLGHLRVPYLFIPENCRNRALAIHVPVTFLNEEKEKAPWSMWLSKHLSVPLVLFKPADFGHRAAKNVRFVEELIQKGGVAYKTVQTKKRSLQIEAFVAKKADCEAITVISASRTYSLDDDLFGPKEFHILRKARGPVFLINPRADLYVLCD